MKQLHKFNYDIFGVSSATLCLAHCILLPLLTILPLGTCDNVLIDSVFGVIALFVVAKIMISNASLTVKTILGLSILMIFISILVHFISDTHNSLIVIGGFGMIIGHVLNYKNHLKKRIKPF